MNKQKKFTYEQHIEIGKKISEITDFLMNLSCDVSNTYGKSSKNTTIANTILKNFELLRYRLDNQFYIDCPGKADSLDAYYYDPERP